MRWGSRGGAAPAGLPKVVGAFPLSREPLPGTTQMPVSSQGTGQEHVGSQAQLLGGSGGGRMGGTLGRDGREDVPGPARPCPALRLT